MTRKRTPPKPEAAQPPVPADLVPTKEAAHLLGLHPVRIGQLVRAGYIPASGARGVVSATAAVAGYIRFLKEGGDRAAASRSAALARSQAAKAQLVADRTARARERLVERQAVEQALDVLEGRALRTLRGMTALAAVPAPLRSAVQAEVAGAVEKIRVARQEATRALRTGDFSEIDGDA